MVWVKLPDETLASPAWFRLPRSARLLFLEMLSWRNRYVTDLNPDDTVPLAGFATDEPDLAAALGALVAEGAIEQTDAGWRLLWLIADQPGREEAEKTRDYNRQKAARVRRHKNGDHSLCTACSALRIQGATRGDYPGVLRTDSDGTPTRPDPTRPKVGGREGGTGARADQPGASSRRPGGERAKPPLTAEERERRVAENLALAEDASKPEPVRKAAKRALTDLGWAP